MQLVLDGAQSMLAQTAAELCTKHEGIDRFRRLRNAEDEIGYSPRVWTEMADLGWTAIPFDEQEGGLGMGLAEAVLITEAMGRVLAPEPFLSAITLAGRALAQAGSAEQKERWLTPTMSGEKRLALAEHERGARYDLSRVETTADRRGDGWVLRGEKSQVLDGFDADAWIVPARTDTGLSLFVVPAGHAGVVVERQWRIDYRNAAQLVLDGVEVGAADLLGATDSGLAILEDAVDQATVALCGEMLGGMTEAFERTLAYLREREQFGTKIGSFQALQHRAASMFIEVELSRSAVMAAARARDEGRGDARALVSNAKARCSDAYVLLANEALQMHGGIGMTDEHDVGLFVKRARASAHTFGDAAYHRRRFAVARGF